METIKRQDIRIKELESNICDETNDGLTLGKSRYPFLFLHPI